MGRKLAKKQKLTFEYFNKLVDQYVDKGMSEETAMDFAWSDCEGMEFDEEDPMIKMIAGGIVSKAFLMHALEDEEEE